MPLPSWSILNVMAGSDFEASLDQHQKWNLKLLDLKDNIYGKNIVDLTPADAMKVKEALAKRGQSTYCFSTKLFNADVELGESHFRKEFLGKIPALIKSAKILQPTFIRLLAATTQYRAEYADSNAYLAMEQSWLFPMYREAVEEIAGAGFKTTIENETGNCIFSTPGEIQEFFTRIDRPSKVGFTWDVLNLWQMGTAPSLEVYKELKPLMVYYHLKGGMANAKGELEFGCALQDSTWPVVEVTKAVIADDVSPLICLNPTHGAKKPGYDYEDLTRKDLEYVRKTFGGE